MEPRERCASPAGLSKTLASFLQKLGECSHCAIPFLNDLTIMNKSVKLNLPLGTHSQATSYRKKNSSDNKKPSQFLYWLFFMLGGIFLFSALLALWPLGGNAQTFYATSGQITERALWSSSWDTSHDLATADEQLGGLRVETGLSAGDFKISRIFIPFNTANLNDDDIVVSASVFLYECSARSNDDNDGDDFINIVQTDEAIPGSPGLNDFDKCGLVDNPIEGSSRLDLGDIATGTYNEFVLNSTALDWINKTGITQLGVREGHDIIDVAYAGADYTANRFYPCGIGETGKEPYLQIIMASSTPEIPTTTPASVPCDTSNFSSDISIISTCGEVWGNSTTAPEKTTYTYYYSPFLLFFYISIIIWTSAVAILIFLIKIG